MPAFTKKILVDEGEANRLKLVVEKKKLEDANIPVPNSLNTAVTKPLLSSETITAALIELTGRIEKIEADIIKIKSDATALAARVTALEVFHP